MRTSPRVKWWGDDRWVLAAACICHSCPVMVQCGEAAKAQGSVSVIRGGRPRGRCTP